MREQEGVEAEAAASEAELTGEAAFADEAASTDETELVDDEPREPVATRTTHEVALVRTVRIGPIMVTCAVIFALAAAITALLLPVPEGEQYTAGQAAGFVLIPAAAIGLLFGAILSLLLNLVAKRKQGAAIAVRTDVR